MLITLRRGFKRLNEKKKRSGTAFFKSKKVAKYSQSRNKPVARFGFGFVFNVIFCFHFVYYHSAVCMHACMHVFFFFKKD